MKYFSSVGTLEELKKEYRKLCKMYHPDKGGAVETMQELNNEYDKAFNAIKDGYNSNLKEGQRRCEEMPEEYREVLEKIINLEGVEIELCGYWLWVSGNTKANKEELKPLGFKWAKKKEDYSLWFWHPEKHGVTSRGKYSMDKIRDIHGSEKISSKNTFKIGA
jgi:curved DNA-binding protein CbpA